MLPSLGATPESAYRKVRQDPGNQSKLDKMLEEDAVVFWRRTVPFGIDQRGFQLRPAKEVREEPEEVTMPAGVVETLDEDGWLALIDGQ